MDYRTFGILRSQRLGHGAGRGACCIRRVSQHTVLQLRPRQCRVPGRQAMREILPGWGRRHRRSRPAPV